MKITGQSYSSIEMSERERKEKKKATRFWKLENKWTSEQTQEAESWADGAKSQETNRLTLYDP